MDTSPADWTVSTPPREPEPADYMRLVEWAGRTGAGDEAWVQKLLEEKGMLVEKIGQEEILLIDAVWPAFHHVQDAIGKRKKDAEPIPTPEWGDSILGKRVEAIKLKGKHAGLSVHDIHNCYLAAPGELSVAKVDKFEQFVNKMIFELEDRVFGAAYGIRWSVETDSALDLIAAKNGWKIGEPLPEQIEYQGKTFKRLEVIEAQIETEKPATEEQTIDADEVADLDALCARAEDCYLYLTEELGWSFVDYAHLTDATWNNLKIGRLDIETIRELVATAEKEGYCENWRGTELATVEETSEQYVDRMCAMLGFVPDNHEVAFNDQQAERFIQSINMIQSMALTTLQQATAIVNQCAQIVERGMEHKGYRLRAWLEATPDLRYEHDTYKKEKDADGNLVISHHKGELKKKSIQTIAGDICIRGTGGHKATTWKIAAAVKQQPEIQKIVQEVQTLCDLHVATLEEPLKSLVVFKFEVTANKNAALELAEAGELIEGVEYLPKNDMAKIMVSPGERKPLSLKKPLDALARATKRFQAACTEDDSDDA